MDGSLFALWMWRRKFFIRFILKLSITRPLLCYGEFTQFLKMFQPFDHLDLHSYGNFCPCFLLHLSTIFFYVECRYPTEGCRPLGHMPLMNQIREAHMPPSKYAFVSDEKSSQGRHREQTPKLVSL